MNAKETAAEIRKMGWVARRNQFGEIWCRMVDCIHKLDHGFGADDWEQAFQTVRAEYARGGHCCEELSGKTSKAIAGMLANKEQETTMIPMTVPKSIHYSLQKETSDAQQKIPTGSVNAHSHARGISRGEPLTVMMDAFLRYAKAYANKYDQPLSSDSVLGGEWLVGIRAVHALLNGDGAVAMESGYTTDSKCNGALESIYWTAIKAAGFTEADGQ